MAVDVRVTNARVMVEEEPDTTNVRVTNARVMVEEEPDFINIIVTNVRLMIEYIPVFSGIVDVTEEGDTLDAEMYHPTIPDYYMASAYETQGIGIAVHHPLVRGGQYIKTITHLIQAYSHTISANGGFMSATITLAGDQPEIEDWYADGIGRHIVVVNPAGYIIWEGFVDTVEAVIGSISATRGPLINVANRVSATYTPIIDETVEPPVTGTETETVIVEDVTSQQRYGIWEKVISAGTVLDDDAEYIRDTFLEDNREPESSTSISFGGSNENAAVTLQCKGYVEWLNYAYNDDTENSVMVSTKIADIITEDTNSIFSLDQSHIETNGILTSAFENGNRMGKAIIDEIITMGDINDLRWIYGCYENRLFYYYAAPTDIEYTTHLSFPEQRIYLNNTIEVAPWDVRPGKWIELLDFRIAATTPADNYENPRTVFIEDVTYTAPNQVILNGNKVKRLPQLMARMGVG